MCKIDLNITFLKRDMVYVKEIYKGSILSMAEKIREESKGDCVAGAKGSSVG